MTKRTTLAQWLASCQESLQNCHKSGNREWETKWRARLAQLRDLLPSGSGVDNGTTIVEISPERIKLACGFHHMTDNGVYDRWTHHSIRVVPSWNGIRFTSVSGEDYREIKEYLIQLYEVALNSYVTWDEPTQSFDFVAE